MFTSFNSINCQRFQYDLDHRRVNLTLIPVGESVHKLKLTNQNSALSVFSIFGPVCLISEMSSQYFVKIALLCNFA